MHYLQLAIVIIVKEKMLPIFAERQVSLKIRTPQFENFVFLY